jgi:hypothetical protein
MDRGKNGLDRFPIPWWCRGSGRLLGGPDARPSVAHYSDDWEGVDSFAKTGTCLTEAVR